jgi:hypothetical protein
VDTTRDTVHLEGNRGPRHGRAGAHPGVSTSAATRRLSRTHRRRRRDILYRAVRH